MTNDYLFAINPSRARQAKFALFGWMRHTEIQNWYFSWYYKLDQLVLAQALCGFKYKNHGNNTLTEPLIRSLADFTFEPSFPGDPGGPGGPGGPY